MARFDFHAISLAGVYLIETRPLQDVRGDFERLFCQEEFHALGLIKPLVQINRSMTRQKGAIRGLHFQWPPYTETKIVCCLRGTVFDVVVDLRAGSSTFLCWQSMILNSANTKMVYIPEGFAHGFQTLEEQVELMYLTTEFYQADHDAGLRFNDPKLNIQWQLPPTIISERDQEHPLLDDHFQGLVC